MRRTLGAALAATFVCLGASQALAQQSFEGKTVRLIINFTSGGPLDTFFRAVMPHLQRHIPGSPNMMIEHRPGAGGRTGAAYLYTVAKPDGLSIGTMVGVASDAIIGLDSKFDAMRFTWLGAIPQTQVTMMRPNLNIASHTELKSVEKPLMFAALGRATNNFISSSLAMKMLNVPVRDVHGYPGQAATIHALRQREADLADAGAPFFLPNRETWLKEGLRPLIQRGDLQVDGSFRRSPLIPEVPTFEEALRDINPQALETDDFAAYRLMVSAYAVHYGIIAPPGMDPDLAATLSKAVEATFNDPRTAEDIRKQLNLEYNFVTAGQVHTILENIDGLAKANPRAREILQRLARDK